jgi:transcriptional regulator with XRE-family HTH domain
MVMSINNLPSVNIFFFTWNLWYNTLKIKYGVGAMTLGDRLKKSRMQKGLTQVQTAKILGIANTALSNYERGERDPDTTLLKRLSELYGVSTDYLLGNNRNLKVDIVEILEDRNKQVTIGERTLTWKERSTIKSILYELPESEKTINHQEYTPGDIKNITSDFPGNNIDDQLEKAVVAASHQSRQMMQISPDLRDLIKEEVVKILEERKARKKV